MKQRERDEQMSKCRNSPKTPNRCIFALCKKSSIFKGFLKAIRSPKSLRMRTSALVCELQKHTHTHVHTHTHTQSRQVLQSYNAASMCVNFKCDFSCSFLDFMGKQTRFPKNQTRDLRCFQQPTNICAALRRITQNM